MNKKHYNIATKYKWYFIDNYLFTKIDNKQKSFSKVVFNLRGNELLYHKSGNVFDYRESQIQILARTEFPKVAKRDKTSKYIGVYLKGDNWMVILEDDSSKEYMGSYYTEIDAAIVADYHLFIKYGVFDNDRLNFKWNGEEELINKYQFLCKRYGKNTSERASIVSQGKSNNRRKAKTSKYVGVYKVNQKRLKCWAAEIRKNKKRYHLGYFYTEEDAAKAYDIGALTLYGDQAITNFPMENYRD